MLKHYSKNIFIILSGLTLFLIATFVNSQMNMSTNSNQYSIKPFNDDSYKVSWSVDESTKKIKFNLDVETTGWVGLGFSKDGKMAGSDMIMCYIDKSSQTQCSDRYASGYSVPQLDTELNGKNDLESVSGSLSNGRTIISFTRSLDTTESNNDYKIEQGKDINVIFSYRINGNPDNENGQFMPHSKYTGMKLVLYPLANQSVENKGFLADTSIKKIKLGFDNYPISSNQTSYVCKNFDIQKNVQQITGYPLGTTYHAIAYEPIIDKAEYVHHIVIFSCDADVEITNTPYSCSAFSLLCPKIHFEWAPGSGIFNLPNEVGILWGVAENRKIIVQIHYNNYEGKVTNTVDSSYINVYFTAKLRKYDAATMINGVNENFINVPAKTTNYMISDECSSSCTSRINDSIYIYSVFLHGHLSLRKIRTEIKYANGTIDSTTIREDNFKFDNQKYVYLNSPIKISSGDILTTYCIYDNNSDKPVNGGEASTEEMCFAFINYYPRERGLSTCIGKIPPMFGCVNFGLYNRTDNSLLLSNNSYFVKLNYYSVVLIIILGLTLLF